ncbi:MAG: hypothetical protein ABIK28_15445 [Planctomycetota bacterium]
MRISVVGVILIMTSILVLAVLLTSHYREVHFEGGSGVTVVLLRSTDTEGLHKAVDNENSPLMRALHQQGVSFKRCYASSPWYPSAFASLMSGLYPSEHGLHPDHAYLSSAAGTLAEKLGICGYRTMVACGKASPLKDVNALQGFSFVEITEPRETISSFLDFKKRLSENRPFFAVVEVDLDAFGGPELLDTVLEILYDGLGRDTFLERNILGLIAPGVDAENRFARKAGFSPDIPVVFAGKPLHIATGKCVLKAVSICDLKSVIYDLALGQGFNIRDSVRNGRSAVYEAVLSPSDLVRGEVTQPPPYFYRAFWFDNDPNGYSIYPNTDFQLLSPEGELSPLPSESADQLREQYDLFITGRKILPDLAILHTAGDLLDESVAERLGQDWQRPELLGQNLHAVEHYRMAETLRDAGFPALAVSELNCTLVMNPCFAHAHFMLAEVYASIDRIGAKKHFLSFIEKFKGFPELSPQVEEARRYLSTPSE